MDMLRNAIFTACITAMISAAVMMIAPDGRRRELRLICTLVMICCVAAGITGAGGKLNSAPQLPDSGELSFDYRNMLLTKSRTAITRKIEQQLEEKGYSVEKIVIELSFDQYNYIKTDKAEIYVSGLETADEQNLISAVREVVGKDTEVTVHAAGDKGSDE